MTLHFINATLIDPENGTEFEGSVSVEGDRITAVTKGGIANPKGKIIDCGGKYLAPGIVDLGVKVCEPGERHKESYRSAGLAAAKGAAPVHVLPMAALTKGRIGREMTEIGFLMDAGAVAFTDCDHVITDTKVFARALTYACSLGALVIAHPQEPILSKGAAATSGKFASLRGLAAVSPMAERMGLDRDIALIEMTGARYHADQITSARSLPALERAKRNGLDVTAGVGIHHLTLNALDVANYRTFFKLKPPLRDEDDRIAIVPHYCQNHAIPRLTVCACRVRYCPHMSPVPASILLKLEGEPCRLLKAPLLCS